jgi:hypothetical protein
VSLNKGVNMSSLKANSLWSWPGPFRLYEWLILVILFVPAYLSKSGFAIAVATALMLCGVYLTAAYDKDLRKEDWSRFNYAVWIIRIAAIATGYWLFIKAPNQGVLYATLLAYVFLYIFSESTAWHHKRAIEAATLR